MRILHQAGHNTIWNIDSYEKDDCGDGIIFSPVHIAKDRLENISVAIKARSLFDAQFYIPDSQKAKLQSYEFFPEVITGGFSTREFEAIAHKSASMCLDFQLKNDFESLVVPARYFADLVSDFITKQKAFTVEPFLAEIVRRKISKKTYLTLPVTSAMTLDKNYRQELLNWISSYPEISGVYFLNEIGENTKQICNFPKLQAHIDFIEDLKQASLEVIVGYCNTESIVLTLLDPDGIGIGAYENTRGFSVDKFLEEDTEIRGPAPRLYFPKLLNWIRYDTAVEIRQDHPEIWNKIYTPTEYSEHSFSRGRPHFTHPEPYKHHFILICNQIKELAQLNLTQRIDRVKKMIANAKSLYDEIESSGVMYFDRNCSGDHLPVWNRIVHRFR